jgi:hypothetical protein
MPAAVTLLVALLLLQGNAPLRKSDLVRLLSGSVMSPGEITQLVRRNCLTFDPTERDRNDFRQLGAEAALLAAVDECARRRSAPRPVSVTPVRSVRSTPPPPPPPTPPTVPASAERSGFVSGGGQRGVGGSRVPRAVVFEVRDAAGAPLANRLVVFTGVNARTEPATAPTDAAGQARVGVTLGERVGNATVIASIGAVEKQVAFNVAAGPAAQLVVACGAATLAGRFTMRADSVVRLHVAAQDGFTNGTTLLGLRAAVADARIVRVLTVTQDSLTGQVMLKPGQPGTTSLAVIANGMRQYLTVTVPPRAAIGRVDCR